jgi:hypothetical protein
MTESDDLIESDDVLEVSRTNSLRAVFSFVIVLVILGTAAGVAAILYVNRVKPEQVDTLRPVPTVDTIPLIPGAHTVRLSSEGVVQSRREVSLAAEVAGRVVSIADQLVAGGRVKEGDVLATIDDADYQVALRQAKTAVAEAELSIEQEAARGVQAQRDWEKLGRGEAPDLVLRKPQIAAAEARLARHPMVQPQPRGGEFPDAGGDARRLRHVVHVEEGDLSRDLDRGRHRAHPLSERHAGGGRARRLRAGGGSHRRPPGIKKIRSSASQNVGVVTVEVETGYDVRDVMSDVKSRVDAIDNFPEEAEKPVLEEILIKSPVMSLTLVADTDEATLRAGRDGARRPARLSEPRRTSLSVDRPRHPRQAAHLAGQIAGVRPV